MHDAFLASLGDAPDGKVGRIRTITVIGRDAAAAGIRWTADGTSMTGRAENWNAFEPASEIVSERVLLDSMALQVSDLTCLPCAIGQHSRCG
jgi:hypothetical protein